MSILSSLIEKTEFRGTETDMRGGVPVFEGSEQYGGLVVPSGLNVQTRYAPKQLKYEHTDVMMGGGVHMDHEVIPDHLFDQLAGSIEKTRQTSHKTKRSTNGPTTNTNKTKKNI
jgi:hypothetical protein